MPRLLLPNRKDGREHEPTRLSALCENPPTQTTCSQGVDIQDREYASPYEGGEDSIYALHITLNQSSSESPTRAKLCSKVKIRWYNLIFYIRLPPWLNAKLCYICQPRSHSRVPNHKEHYSLVRTSTSWINIMVSYLLLTVATLQGVRAWGSLGHATVAYIAQNYVTDEVATWYETFILMSEYGLLILTHKIGHKAS